jgi:hypothetical protein
MLVATSTKEEEVEAYQLFSLFVWLVADGWC